MFFSRIFRIVLLALLPVIGIAIYLNGQDYDSALVNLREIQSSETGAAMESFLPDRISDLNRIGAVRSFTKETLYEYIDGHAEYYISAGFSRLVVGEYGMPERDAESPDLIIQIYDMVKGIQAFGVLSDESGGLANGSSSDIFTAGSTQGVNFSCGRYYVKLLAYDQAVPIDTVQREVRLKTGLKDEDIPEFARFPELGEVVKTRYVREAYRGISFFNSVMEREYKADGSAFDVALYLGDGNEVEKITDLFMKHFKESGIDYTPADINGTAIYNVKDPYEGDWVLIPLSDSLFGVYGDVDDDIIEKVLEGEKNK